MIELTDAAAQDLEGSCGPLPCQTGEKPYTNVRILTDTTFRHDRMQQMAVGEIPFVVFPS